MNGFAKAATLAVTAAALTLGSVGAASADGWRHRHRDDALIGGAVGLATGLVVGSAIANSGPRYVEGPRYIDPPVYDDGYYEAAPPPVVYRARPVYVEERRYYAPVRSGLEPWTPQWQRYCAYRYRSFDPRSGTFIGNDGRSHFCTAN
ncbi:BA14K family protein [Oryzifoliimicrobium ureilyticus]|uniref:BA14K family protein n=1 Tax=Oryzifoliimicrobium ureilyticus TaxID=3113724 RepID=UPI0030768723